MPDAERVRVRPTARTVGGMARILMVLTSHSELGDTGRSTGLWLEEFAAPYYVFRDAGHEVVLASPRGGAVPVDPTSEAADARTDSTERFASDDEARAALGGTTVLSEAAHGEYDAVFYPGGHGPLWDLVNDEDSQALVRHALESKSPLGLVCHAPAVLHGVADANGTPLVTGRVVTGFTDSEEEQVGLADVVPFSLQRELIADGADFRHGDDWADFIEVDGALVTGQNPTSSASAARRLLEVLADATS